MVQPIHQRQAAQATPQAGPQGAQAAQQTPAASPPLSVLLGVAVQAALYWSGDDPARPAWAGEAERALQTMLGGMPTPL